MYYYMYNTKKTTYIYMHLVFSHLAFWSGNLFLTADFSDLCLLLPFCMLNRLTAGLQTATFLICFQCLVFSSYNFPLSSLLSPHHSCKASSNHGMSMVRNYDSHQIHLSRHEGKPTICIGENKGADQLRSNCEADQRLCFRYSDSTVPLLFKSEISSF